MSLASATARFDEVLRAGPGTKLLGQITNLKDGSSNFEEPVRILLVAENSPAQAGMEVTSPGGFKYLLAENGNDYSSGVLRRSFIMVRLDRQDIHSRVGTITDPVTKLKRDNVTLFAVPVWYQARSLRLTDGVLNIPEARYSVMTSAELAVGDTLGELRILHAEKRLGVWFAEAR